MKIKSNLAYWIAALVITGSAAVYQRTTGPTCPFRVSQTFEGVKIKCSLPRSLSLDESSEIAIGVEDASIGGTVHHRRVPTNEPWVETRLVTEERNGKRCLVAGLPRQPAAGKIAYFVTLNGNSSSMTIGSGDRPVVLRYRGMVPGWVLIPHVLLMFAGMFFSSLAGLYVLGKNRGYRLCTNLALGSLFLGGMIFGPLVQKFAFGAYWTGVPFGWDLTDNKMLLGCLVWGVAAVANWKKERPRFSLVAAIVLLIVFSIPHSMFGSELNPATGVIGQGCFLRKKGEQAGPR